MRWKAKDKRLKAKSIPAKFLFHLLPLAFSLVPSA